METSNSELDIEPAIGSATSCSACRGSNSGKSGENHGNHFVNLLAQIIIVGSDFSQVAPGIMLLPKLSREPFAKIGKRFETGVSLDDGVEES